MSYVPESVYLSRLLRHKPETIDLDMDIHGYVSVNQLIQNSQKKGKYAFTYEILKEIVETDDKQRYRFKDNDTYIKACQGHSIPWVEPELTYKGPPQYLYHGTNTKALEKILNSGHLDKMKRHAVHLQAVESKAWQSAKRWHLNPVVIKIDASKMKEDGYIFGVSDNDVWCIETVPAKYFVEYLYKESSI